MKKVIIESPYAGSPEEIALNIQYLADCARDCVLAGYSPIASHGWFPAFLDDKRPNERALGIKAGLAWASAADYIFYYMDRGMSPGMRYALHEHVKAGREIEMRYLSKRPYVVFDYPCPDTGALKTQKVAKVIFMMQKNPYYGEEQVLIRGLCLTTYKRQFWAVSSAVFYPQDVAGMALDMIA